MANSVEKQDNRPYAVVLYGATSFVGQITAKYLSQFLADSNDVEWAIAGRDERGKLMLRRIGPWRTIVSVFFVISKSEYRKLSKGITSRL